MYSINSFIRMKVKKIIRRVFKIYKINVFKKFVLITKYVIDTYLILNILICSFIIVNYCTMEVIYYKFLIFSLHTKF